MIRFAHALGRGNADRFKTMDVREMIRKVSADDLRVGVICADRDGNRIRIDRIDRAAGKLSYHFLNDELRVQEGIQEPSIEDFLGQGWYAAGTGTL